MKAAKKIVNLHYADSRTYATYKQKHYEIPKNAIKHSLKSIESTVNEKGKFKVLSEPECHKVMSVLRQTNVAASMITLNQRMHKKQQAKQLKKFTNKTNFKKSLIQEKNKNSLRNRIKLMRKQRIFPQPIGPTNYKRQFGLLRKIVIK